jgi:hypothetical protein
MKEEGKQTKHFVDSARTTQRPYLPISAVISATTAEPCSDESYIGSAGSLPSPLGLRIFMHVEHA